MYFFNKDSVYIFLIIYLLFVLILAKFGTYKSIGALKAFFISLFFTPFVGFFIILLSNSKENKDKHRKVKIYKCKHCSFEFRYSFDKCPVCGAERNAES